MRGIDLIAAVRVVAETGDLSRFQNPRELMGYLGLVPSQRARPETRSSAAAVMKIRGHYAYYGISGNIRRLRRYANEVVAPTSRPTSSCGRLRAAADRLKATIEER